MTMTVPPGRMVQIRNVGQSPSGLALAMYSLGPSSNSKVRLAAGPLRYFSFDVRPWMTGFTLVLRISLPSASASLIAFLRKAALPVTQVSLSYRALCLRPPHRFQLHHTKPPTETRLLVLPCCCINLWALSSLNLPLSFTGL